MLVDFPRRIIRRRLRVRFVSCCRSLGRCIFSITAVAVVEVNLLIIFFSAGDLSCILGVGCFELVCLQRAFVFFIAG